MKVKVSEAFGPVLDWMVAKGEGEDAEYVLPADQFTLLHNENGSGLYCYSTDWSQGGPIIEREGIATRRSKGKWYAMLSDDLGDGERAQWTQFTFRNIPKGASTSRKCRYEGPTQLIAAMRCYVASKLGDEVEVPNELA
jgi:hypothetical protein